MVAPMLTATDLATRMPLPLRTAQRWWSSARDTLGFDPAALHDRLRPYPNVLGAVLRLAGEFETAEDDEEDE